MRIKDAFLCFKNYANTLWYKHKSCALCCSLLIFFAGIWIGNITTFYYSNNNCNNKIKKIFDITDLHNKCRFTTITFIA